MKIRGNRIRQASLTAAAEFASRASGATVVVDVERHYRARTHINGYSVFLYGDGTVNKRRSAHNRYRYAASYEQWGHFINDLFRADPGAFIGEYTGRADFDQKTDGKFPQVVYAVAA